MHHGGSAKTGLLHFAGPCCPLLGYLLRKRGESSSLLCHGDGMRWEENSFAGTREFATLQRQDENLRQAWVNAGKEGVKVGLSPSGHGYIPAPSPHPCLTTHYASGSWSVPCQAPWDGEDITENNNTEILLARNDGTSPVILQSIYECQLTNSQRNLQGCHSNPYL